MPRNITISLMFAAIFLMVAIFLGRNYSSDNNIDNNYKDFQKEIYLKESRLANELEDFAQEYQKRKDSLRDIPGNTTDIYTRDGFAFFIYENDTLVYWSTNEIPLHRIFIERYENSRILPLENGYYFKQHKETGKLDILGLCLIKKSYPYQNQYLNNRFQQDFDLPSTVEISFEQNQHRITTQTGDFLFSLLFPAEQNPSSSKVLVLFGLYLLSFVFIVTALIFTYRRLLKNALHPYISFTIFILSIVLIRFIIVQFQWPHILYTSKLFGPFHYATSILLPSLGDLIVNSLLVMVIGFVFYAFFHINEEKIKQKRIMRRYFAISTLLFHVLIFSKVLIKTIQGIIVDSAVPLDLNNIFAFNEYSILAYFAIAFLIFAYFFVAVKLLYYAYIQSTGIKMYLISSAIGLIIFITICLFSNDDCQIINIIFGTVLILSFWLFQRKNQQALSIYLLIFYLIIFTGFITYYIQIFNEEKEITSRKLLVEKLSNERDKIAEFSFREIENKIMNDSIVQGMMNKEARNLEAEQATYQYLKENYFTGYWGKYDIQVTLCHSKKELSIQPDDYLINCHDYFDGIIEQMGGKTICEHLYFLDDGTESINYIAIIPFKGDTIQPNYPVNLYLEISSRFVPKGLGYPELLIDKEQRIATELSGYSYGIYVNRELIKNVGNYFFSINLDDYQTNKDKYFFFDKNGYNHLHYNAENNTDIIISKRNLDFLDKIAPFSYLLIFFTILGCIFYFIIHPPGYVDKEKLTFRARLQISMIGVVIISFIIIGISSISYLVNLNHNKNEDNLSEKAHSVLIELEHKLAAEDELTVAMNPYLNSILTKFSLVFFTDINLYNLKGELLASSRPEIFDQGLIAPRMNAPAYDKLTHYKRALFIQDECIGNYNYLSAYVPFRNDRNELIAFLNLPYFARQTEIRNEISNFLVAFLNIYVILIALAVFLALIISNHVTRPLLLIREKMRRVQLGKSNEKITWERQDEIGQLVMEYNRMIDELSKSADLLAKSERELAWREMARQVAHEIKNPLTPMKLNVQYLKRAWDENRPDIDGRITRFTESIIEQIDSLSLIASEFSDFAKMPRTQKEKVDLNQVIIDSIELYKDHENIRIRYSANAEAPFHVYSDKKQLLRVFGNLLKNSTQAIGKHSEGKILIQVNVEEERYLISIHDNGSGIPGEQAHRIFSPSFTTKSSGMGIGLAMVQSIIASSKGNIWFESEENKGTIFYIRLPKYDDQVEGE